MTDVKSKPKSKWRPVALDTVVSSDRHYLCLYTFYLHTLLIFPAVEETSVPDGFLFVLTKDIIISPNEVFGDIMVLASPPAAAARRP